MKPLRESSLEELDLAIVVSSITISLDFTLLGLNLYLLLELALKYSPSLELKTTIIS